ncbi:MAG: hypothetical protein RLZZ324_469 [Candidatus Parcubacteria bacterium]|jgi:hypothetical protein
MTPELINRVVALVQKQGDRIVLADSATGKAVVLMDLGHYEQLVAGAEAGLASDAPVMPAAAPALPQPVPVATAAPVAAPVAPVAPPAPAPEPEPVRAHQESAPSFPAPMRAVLERLAPQSAVHRPALTYTPAPQPASVAPQVEAQVKAPALSPKRMAAEGLQPAAKAAAPSDNPFTKRGRELGVSAPPEAPKKVDLTQAELLDKINRDIGDWKTAQERKRSEELSSVAVRPEVLDNPSNEDSGVEDEERFYLEPIE